MSGNQNFLPSIGLILGLQLVGESFAQLLALSIPGPVIGMAMFVVLLMIFPSLAHFVKGTALGILSYLSLLFVPAGVGVVRHLQTLGTDAMAILIVIVGSTLITLAVTAFAFSLTLRLRGNKDA